MELIEIEQTDNLTVVALRGRLDTSGVDQVEMRFNAMLAARGKNAVVDFSEVDFLSSMGVRMLLTMARTLGRKNARLALAAPQPLVRESLEHAALDDIIPIAPDLDRAKQLLASAPDGSAPAAG
jgi:anti-anti-sigma factor